MRAFVVGAYVSANFLFVPSLPRAGQTAAATAYFHDHGGKGLNLAIGLHRLGVATDLLLAVGDDPRGREITQLLRDMGLSTEHVHIADAPSAFGIGLIAPDGANLLAAYMGANALLGETQVEQARQTIEAAAYCLGQFEAPEPAVRAAFGIAKAAGRVTYLNPSPWRQPSDELLALTDIMVVNEPEAMDFLGLSEAGAPAEVWARDLPELAKRRGWRGEILVVTLAERGAVALKGGASIFVPAFAIDQVDATGAGDGFGCGLVSALAAGESLETALRQASACGALVASRTGVFDTLPHAADLQDFLSCRATAPD
ncbi:ribokinase [Rhodoblastus acidophilus]|uniref:PfkB family carbohydrate kinase n=1 Tax=Rhodoblastus acidophilus TaxID=1074 RepID=UPI002223F205|nr:PfkB family carbohydrate kinase [Rhodoblastus acidophilus]MCW2286619.1 ribokinase [Rhodoblastus acidophilus]MCW2335469.1 ribokinase [Rhodoblastus acidophilus]